MKGIYAGQILKTEHSMSLQFWTSDIDPILNDSKIIKEVIEQVMKIDHAEVHGKGAAG